LRIALGLLERPGAPGLEGAGTGSGNAGVAGMGSGSIEILNEAMRRLGKEASEKPGEYLAGYQAMRRILGEVPRERGAGMGGAVQDRGAGRGDAGGAGAGDVLLVQRAIRKLLPETEAVPSAGRGHADAGLSGLYFNYINDPLGKP